MKKVTIFYSWQNKHRKANRFFIEDCLKRVVKEVSQEQSIKIHLNQDSRTKAGASDISAEIFSSIDNSEIFVADVSLINSVPNPNVMVELGYAAAKLKWDNLLLIMNENSGIVDSLPFDLRGRKTVLYKLDEKDDKKDARAILCSQIKVNLKHMLIPLIKKLSETNRKKTDFLRAQLITLLGLQANFCMDIAVSTNNTYIKFPFTTLPSLNNLKSTLSIVKAREKVVSNSQKGGFKNWYDYLNYLKKTTLESINNINDLVPELNSESINKILDIKMLLNSNFNFEGKAIGNQNLEHWSDSIISLFTQITELSNNIKNYISSKDYG